ncbi:MAG: hypothetical protein V1800_18815, partial [Candidatus Latescibacterota bacterium]
ARSEICEHTDTTVVGCEPIWMGPVIHNGSSDVNNWARCSWEVPLSHIHSPSLRSQKTLWISCFPEQRSSDFLLDLADAYSYIVTTRQKGVKGPFIRIIECMGTERRGKNGRS